MCVGSGAGIPDIMSDKEKLRLARNLVKANNKRIKNTLRIIEIALEEIDDLINDYESVHKVYVISSHSGGSNGARATNKATVTKKTIDDLEKIKRILEKSV